MELVAGLANGGLGVTIGAGEIDEGHGKTSGARRWAIEGELFAAKRGHDIPKW
jgi:hypothetical protein